MRGAGNHVTHVLDDAAGGVVAAHRDRDGAVGIDLVLVAARSRPCRGRCPAPRLRSSPGTCPTCDRRQWTRRRNRRSGWSAGTRLVAPLIPAPPTDLANGTSVTVRPADRDLDARQRRSERDRKGLRLLVSGRGIEVGRETVVAPRSRSNSCPPWWAPQATDRGCPKQSCSRFWRGRAVVRIAPDLPMK